MVEKGGIQMSSRSLQVKALEQKIERLQAQLDYLKKIDEIEAKQSKEINKQPENTESL